MYARGKTKTTISKGEIMKSLIYLGLLYCGLFAKAQETTSAVRANADFSATCGSMSALTNDNGGGTYDLKPGFYESSDKNTPWCSSYKLNQIKHFSCNNNIYSFVLSCNSGNNWSATFNCNQSGVCTTGDADARTVRVAADNRGSASYSKKNGETIASTQLVYTGPCE